jgi:hypothetical protein
MWSILVAGAALILHVSRILHGNGTLTHYRGLRDDGRMRGHRGRGSTYGPSARRSPREGHIHSANPWPACRLTIEATLNLPSSARAIRSNQAGLTVNRSEPSTGRDPAPGKGRNPGARAGIWITVDR